MTVLFGIFCRDGVVVGADSSTTFNDGQTRTIEQPSEKISILCGNAVIIAGTGQVGAKQRFCDVVNKRWRLIERPKEGSHGLHIAKDLAKHTLEDFMSTHMNNGEFGALAAYSTSGSFHLCEFPPNSLQPELKDENIWYVSMGSGQPIVDPFLAFIRGVFWTRGRPTLTEGLFAATWALDHAIEVNPGGINGPARLSVLEEVKKGQFVARMITNDELSEHRQNIEEAKSALRNFSRAQQPEAGGNVPIVPMPSSNSDVKT